MNQMKAETKVNDGQLQSNCNVNMTFNFAVGGLAIAAALLIGYLVYAYWLK
ncbi:MAG: hypothetical protein M3495_13010 [Pseudomonadota bacterium]|nr:hypothetical protein [Pseudomonadota bacterium]